MAAPFSSLEEAGVQGQSPAELRLANEWSGLRAYNRRPITGLKGFFQFPVIGKAEGTHGAVRSRGFRAVSGLSGAREH